MNGLLHFNLVQDIAQSPKEPCIMYKYIQLKTAKDAKLTIKQEQRSNMIFTSEHGTTLQYLSFTCIYASRKLIIALLSAGDEKESRTLSQKTHEPRRNMAGNAV